MSLTAAALRKVSALAWRLMKVAFMFTGFMVLVGLPSCRAMPFLYADAYYPRLLSPGKDLAVFRKVTTGGFGTVWTTRILVEDVQTKKQQTIYENHDSDYEPVMRWLDAETLEIGLPCDRVDHVSNPADYDNGITSMDRYAVRFYYARRCRSKSQEQGGNEKTHPVLRIEPADDRK